MKDEKLFGLSLVQVRFETSDQRNRHTHPAPVTVQSKDRVHIVIAAEDDEVTGIIFLDKKSLDVNSSSAIRNDCYTMALM